MACYLLRAGDTERVKIGFAVSVQDRIEALQAGNCERLILLRTWAGTRQTEAWLHRRFADVRIAREWFVFHPDMLEQDAPEECPPANIGPVAEIIDALGGPTIVSNSLHLPATTVGNWRLRNSIPAKYHRAVLDLSDGKLTADEIVAAHAEPVGIGRGANV